MAKTPDTAPVTANDKPKFVVTLGRGGTGKSTLVRFVVERAQAAGRETAICDADRTNATLSSYFEGVLRPELPDDQTVTDWLDNVVNTQAEERISLILDVGGGDQVFRKFAASLELTALFDSVGIAATALHFIGPDIDDLAYLRDIEVSKAFCPAQTGLILSEALIKDARPKEAAFEAVRNHSIYKTALARGAREVWFPRLSVMQDINTKRMSFGLAERSLGLTNRQRVAIWRRDTETALAPISDWLP